MNAVLEPVRYSVQLYAAPPRREYLNALFAIEAAVQDCTRPERQHEVGHRKLEWWAGELHDLHAGRGRHPDSLRLRRACDALAIHYPDLGPLVELARADLAAVAFETAAEIDGANRLWTLAVFDASVTASHAAAVLREAGSAVREIELIRNFAPRARLGRIHAVLDRGLDSVAQWQACPWPAGCAEALAQRLQRARQQLQQAAATLPPPDRSLQRPALTWMALAARSAALALQHLPRPIPARRSSAMRDVWAGWRAASSASLGRLPAALAEPLLELNVRKPTRVRP